MKEREREGCERGETKRDGGQFQGVTEKKKQLQISTKGCWMENRNKGLGGKARGGWENTTVMRHEGMDRPKEDGNTKSNKIKLR